MPELNLSLTVRLWEIPSRSADFLGSRMNHSLSGVVSRRSISPLRGEIERFGGQWR